MAGELKALHGTTTNFVVTNLVNGIALSSIWCSNKVVQANPANTDVIISGKITCNSNIVAGDLVMVHLVPFDGAASGEISGGMFGAAVTESTDYEWLYPTTPMLPYIPLLGTPVKALPVGIAGQSLQFVSSPIPCPYTSFCVTVHAISTAGTVGAAGDVIRYRLSSLQAQS